MNSIPQTTTEQAIRVTKRSDTIIMGHQDFLSVLFRSIGAELYKIRQRTMFTIQFLIVALIMVIAFLVPALGALARNGSLPQASCTTDKHNQQHCTPQNRQVIAEKNKADISAPLRLPNSLTQSVAVIGLAGALSLIILTGSIVGSEYGIGTIRLMLIRGPTRTQFFLAKIGAVIVYLLATLFLLILVGIIAGALFNLTTGIAVNFSFFTAEWMVHAILYVLIKALGLFMYAMIALCLATLGKTTAAGVAGALIWVFGETVLGGVLSTIGSQNKGPVGDFLQSIPNYLIGNNAAALLNHQNQYLTNGARQATANTHVLSDMHAIIVLAIYLVVLIGIAWWVNQQRDVTN